MAPDIDPFAEPLRYIAEQTCSRCGIHTTEGRLKLLGWTVEEYPKSIVACKAEAACARRVAEAEARQRACPTCGAEPGEACVDVRGVDYRSAYRRSIKGVHPKR